MDTQAKKILILDDHSDILEVVSEVLSYQQFDVRTQPNAHNLTQQLKEYAPDLVIIDYKLGEDNGGDICLRLKATPAFQNIPIILYSAYLPSTADVSQYGCDDMMAKPFDMDDLLGRINRLLNIPALSAS